LFNSLNFKARIMLIWLNNHFEDFEGNDSDGKMTALLNEFDQVKKEFF